MEAFLKWLKNPLPKDATATDWFLLVGLILASLYAWHIIMRDISETAKTVLD